MLVIILIALIFLVCLTGIYLLLRYGNGSYRTPILAIFGVGLAHLAILLVIRRFAGDSLYLWIAFPIRLSYGAMLYLVYSLFMKKNVSLGFLIHGLPFLMGLVLYMLVVLEPSLKYIYFNSFYTVLYLTSFLIFVGYLSWLLFDYCMIRNISIRHFINRQVNWGLPLIVLFLISCRLIYSQSEQKVETYLTYNLMSHVIFLTSILILSIKMGKVMSIRRRHVLVQQLLSPIIEIGDIGECKVNLYISDKQKSLYHSGISKFISSEAYLDTGMNKSRFSIVTEIAESHISPFIKENYGKSYNGFLTSLRLSHAAKLLKDENLSYTIDELSFICGFGSRASFYRNFIAEFGCSPHEYRGVHLEKLNNNNN